MKRRKPSVILSLPVPLKAGSILLPLIFSSLLFAQTPTIVSTYPAQNALNVPLAAVITVTFDLDINPATINASTFVVHGSYTGRVSGVYNYDVNTQTATFAPDSPFKVGEQISVTLTNGITVLGGPASLVPFIWEFTVGVLGGSGKFDLANYNVGTSPKSLTAFDRDGNGFNDLGLADGVNGSVYYNDGAGRFTSGIVYGVGGGPYFVTNADVNGNGISDLITANKNGGSVSILSFTNGSDYAVEDAFTTMGTNPVSLTVGDIDANGEQDLAVANWLSEDVSVMLNNGGMFNSVTLYPAASLPTSIAGGDFDGDGDFDLAVVHEVSWNLFIYFNDGTGTYGTPVEYGVGADPAWVIASDLNGDGAADLAVANVANSNISLLFNNGSGIFSSTTSYIVGSSPKSIAAADLDEDGDKDIAVANFGSNNVSILINNGDGTYVDAVNYAVGNGPGIIVASDLDDDGDIDLAVGNTNSDYLSILSNRKRIDDLSISSDSLLFGSTGIGEVDSLVLTLYNNNVDNPLQIGSINSNNSVFSANPSTLSISPGNSELIAITFSPTTSGNHTDSLIINSSDPYNPVSYVYMSGVGDPILVVSPAQNALNVPLDTTITVTFGVDMNPASINTNTFVVHGSYTGKLSGVYAYDSGTKTATFAPGSQFRVGEQVSVTLTTGITSAAGDSLGIPYLWNFNTEVQGGSGTFATKIDYSTGTQPRFVTAADLNDDDEIDLAVANMGSANISVILNSGSGAFSGPTAYNMTFAPYSVVAVDLDGDGDSDLAAVDELASSISVFLNNGSGSYASGVTYGVGSQPWSIASADLDGDGDADLAVANAGNNNVSLLLGNGDGTFSAKTDFATGNNPLSVITADLDGDGTIDLAVVNNASFDVSVLLNDGAGIFSSAVSYAVGQWPRAVAAADLDGDGDADLVVADGDNFTVSVLLNLGSGTYGAAVEYILGTTVSSVTLADFDGDGVTDIAATRETSNSVTVLLGNGDGTFATGTDYPTGSSPLSVFAADLDGDGDSDLAVANYGSTTVSVLLNLNRTADLALSAGSLSFGSNKIGATDTLTFKVHNNGIDSTLQVTSVTSSHTDFTASPSTFSVLPGDSATVTVTFTPTTMATYSDSLTISSNDPQNPVTKVYVSGKGDPIVSTSPTQNALAVPLNSHISVTFGVAINQATFNPNTFVVHGDYTGRLSGNYAYDAGTKTATFTPDNPFKVGESVSVTMTQGVQTPIGNRIGKSLSWEFTAEVLGGSGVFAESGRLYSTGNGNKLAVGDWDMDGDVDLVLSAPSDIVLYAVQNDGSGNFSRTYSMSTWGGIEDVNTGDWDGDGDLDLSLGNSSDDRIAIIHNNAGSSFSATLIDTIQNPHKLASADFDNDGDIDIVTAGWWASYAKVTLLENDASGNFPNIFDLGLLGEFGDVISGDLDNDGLFDIILANSNIQGVMSLMNNGDNTFEYTSSVEAGQALSLGIVDLNRDSQLDLIAGNNNNSSSHLFLNDGTGTFILSETVSIGQDPRSVTVGDWNNDQIMDFAFANQGSNSITILFGEGDGTVASSYSILTGTEPVFSEPSSIVSGDWDDDGDLDLAVADKISGHIIFYTNAGQEANIATDESSHNFGAVKIGSFAQWSFNILNEGGVDSLNVGNIVCSEPDFLIDITSGIVPVGGSLTVTVTFNPSEVRDYSVSLEIISSDPDEPSTNVLLTGTGAPTILSTNPIANSVGVSENSHIFITFVGSMDVTTLNANTFRVFGDRKGLYSGSYAYNSGTQTASFIPSQLFSYGEQLQVVLTEGVQATNGSISLTGGYSFMFTVNSLFGSGKYSADSPIPTGSTPFALAAGDLDGDGYDDLAIANSADNTVSLYVNDQQGGLTFHSNLTTGANPQGVSVGDVDADGDMDIVSGNNSDGTLSLFVNDGAMSFSMSSLATGNGPRRSILGDLDNDGWPDLANIDVSGNTVSIHMGNGSGGFNAPNTLSTGSSPSDLAMADLDNDGDDDIVVTNRSSNNISVFINAGGTFDVGIVYTTGASPNNLTLFDMDGDGDSDVMTANGGGNNVSVLANNGDGTLAAAVNVSAGTQPIALTAYDADADGDLDLAVANFTSNDVHILTNDGLGNFTPTDTIAVGNGPRDIVALDMSGGFGIMDLAAVNLTDNTLQILRNQVPGGIFANVSVGGTGEQSGDVTINYAIYDVSQSLINMLCEYSIDAGANWLAATVVGDTSALDAANHRGSLVWDSANNIVAAQVDALFKVTPYSSTVTGTADSTATFTVDNAHGHSVQIALAESLAEYTDSVRLAIALADPTNDILSLQGYYRIGAGNWQPALLIGTNANIDATKYSQTVIWDSRSDAGSVDIAQVQLKITPTDGWADGVSDSTVFFNLDNNTAPLATLTDLVGEQTGNITIAYTLADAENDPLNLALKYRVATDSSWQSATVNGATTGITSYAGTITWDSGTDLAGVDLSTVQLQLIPSDADQGAADTTAQFHLDNNGIPTIAVTELVGEQKEDVTISYMLTDAESDSLDIYCEYYNEPTTQWLPATTTGSTSGITQYSGNVIWNTMTDLPTAAQYLLFRITPNDNDTGQPDTVELLLDNLGVPSIAITTTITGEVSGAIDFAYQLDDDEGDLITIAPEYSSDSGANWTAATVTGSTVNIGSTNYSGVITWLSASDLPGVDLATVRFRLTPSDANTGIADATDDFHLDNNEPPAISLGELAQVQTGTVPLSHILTDSEGDTLSIGIRYRETGTTVWIPASLNGITTGISTAGYAGTIDWDSPSDLPDFHGTVDLLAIPADNDQGTRDSISFELDNIIASVVISDITSEQSADIEIDYTITNPGLNPVGLLVECSNNSGQSWTQANISGDTTALEPAAYSGTLVWHSVVDFPNYEGTRVVIRITPTDNQVGIADQTTDFHLDNNLPPSLVVGSHEDTVTTFMEISYTLADIESDTLTITSEYTLDQGQSWLVPTITDANANIAPAAYTDFMTWNVLSDVGFQRLSEVQIRLVPTDNDPGDQVLIENLTILNYPADYTGDLVIDFDDLSNFAVERRREPQDLIYEIGPATGTVPDLTVNPDGVIDFEDLVVFAQMWNWSFDHNGFAKSIPTLAKVMTAAPSISLVQRVPDNLYRWDGQIYLDMVLATNQPIMMVDGVISNGATSLITRQVEAGAYWDHEYNESFILSRTNPDSTQMVLAVVGFDPKQNETDKGGELLTMLLEPDRSDQLVSFAYNLRGTDGEVVESGIIDVKVENFLPEQYVLHQNYPNPFNPTTTIRFDLPQEQQVYLIVYDIMGREVVRLVNEVRPSGYHEIRWSGRDDVGKQVASGIYFARLVTPEYSKVIKMLMLK